MTPTPPPESAQTTAARLAARLADFRFGSVLKPDGTERDPQEWLAFEPELMRFLRDIAAPEPCRACRGSGTMHDGNCPYCNQPCENCGCEERDHRGILTCRCPDSPAPREAETGWQPIATAPKNGSEVLGFFPYYGTPEERGSIFVMAWNLDEHAGKPKPFWTAGTGWVWGVRDQRGKQPTHWMPLPPSPQTEAE